jgi:hypothetical protein
LSHTVSAARMRSNGPCSEPMHTTTQETPCQSSHLCMSTSSLLLLTVDADALPGQWAAASSRLRGPRRWGRWRGGPRRSAPRSAAGWAACRPGQSATPCPRPARPHSAPPAPSLRHTTGYVTQFLALAKSVTGCGEGHAPAPVSSTRFPLSPPAAGG